MRKVDEHCDAVHEKIRKFLAEVRQKSEAEIKDEVRACVKEFIWKDIKKQPKDLKPLEDRVAQLEPLAIKLTNENTALAQRNADLELKTTQLSNQVTNLTENMTNLRADYTRLAAFVQTHHERLSYPYVPGV